MNIEDDRRFSVFEIADLFKERYQCNNNNNGLENQRNKPCSKKKLTLIKKWKEDRRSFQESDRSSRRGIVISSSVDQMESMVIDPVTGDICTFRISVYGRH